jgi:PKD repeat protein
MTTPIVCARRVLRVCVIALTGLAFVGVPGVGSSASASSSLSGAATRSVTVTRANQSPVVDAGPNQSVVRPNAVTLSGSVTDDGLPNPPGATTSAWSKVTGPGMVTFAAPSSPSTSATFSAAGTYVLRLTGDDSALSASDDVTVTVADPETPPTAALTVTPSSGVAPLTVTADASASADADATPIASYTFDFGDGTTVGPQAGATATHTYVSAGSRTVTVTVTDTANLTGTLTKTVTVTSANLVGNPGFETNTAGWNVSGSGTASLARVTGGHSGVWSGKLTNTGTSSTTCVLNDHPNWVATTTNRTYTATLWVRGDVAGGSVVLRIREYQGITLVGSAQVSITLSTTWQQVSLAYTPAAPGSSSLDLNASRYSTPPGTCFYADDASEIAS